MTMMSKRRIPQGWNQLSRSFSQNLFFFHCQFFAAGRIPRQQTSSFEKKHRTILPDCSRRRLPIQIVPESLIGGKRNDRTTQNTTTPVSIFPSLWKIFRIRHRSKHRVGQGKWLGSMRCVAMRCSVGLGETRVRMFSERKEK